MFTSFEQKTIDLLTQPNFATLSTLREDGSVHAVVIWYGLEGDRLALNSAEGRDWPANVRRDTRVTVTIPNSANP